MSPPSLSSEHSLQEARQQIESIDRSILELIEQRVRIGRELALVKRAQGQPLLDPAQEARVVRRAAEYSRDTALPEEEVRDLFWRLVALTRRCQEALE